MKTPFKWLANNIELLFVFVGRIIECFGLERDLQRSSSTTPLQ